MLVAAFSAGSLNMLPAQVYNRGNMYISGNVYVMGNIQNANVANYLNNGNFYLDGSFTNDQAAMVYGTGTSSGTLILRGSTTPVSLTGTQPIRQNNLTLNKTTTTSLVNMGVSVTARNNLTLQRGIITTGTNLFTYENIGTISMPGTGLGQSGSGAYTDSYIATCDAAGTPVTDGASATTPNAGTQGFKMLNVTAVNTYFPIGATYIPVLTGGTPSPNRMMINNQYGTPTDYTVIVNIGDIGKTVATGGIYTTYHVNRIWYVKSSVVNGRANMRLFFTKRTTGSYPSTQNEVELPGFDYSICALVEKNYEPLNNGFIRLSSGADLINNIGAGTETEIYGQYTIGVSPDAGGATGGIDTFYRFSVVNPGSIILPVTVTDLKAALNGTKVEVTWTSLDEVNIDRYTVERAADAVHFNPLGDVKARNNGQQENKYAFTDAAPRPGANYYRVKVWDNSGRSNYTNVVKINIDNSFNNSGFRIFPNPVRQKQFTLQMQKLDAGKYTVIVTAINGQRVMETTIDYAGGLQNFSLKLPAGTAAGTYHILLRNGNYNGKTMVVVE